KINEMGRGSMLEGMLVGIERGYFQSEIADAAFREQELYEKGRLVKVGVNEFVDESEEPIDTLVIGPEVEDRQIDAVRRMRTERVRGERVPEAFDRVVAAVRPSVHRGAHTGRTPTLGARARARGARR